ncbi:Clr5 protein [Schizosaccharomyces osmophilus]|uniref:Clr5 protein n=1 Tax=Schizosaccharomyces osmophilus TaxID=2545709 RepID=A0AAF0AW27_9SCHI|nr:Clr5 protein [Schizosaccharomyces osmophilus]WBW72650.1 Clr5 protein [Schizosaccharomyces osmophilus]
MTKEWDGRREQIVELSKVHGMTVRELQTRMSKLYNFEASIRSYKRVLARWGIHIHRQRFILPRTEEAVARTATGDVSKALDELVAQLFFARQSDKDSLAQIEANFGLRLSKRALHYRRKRLSLKRAITKTQDSSNFHDPTSSSPTALHLSQQQYPHSLSSASRSQEQQSIPLLVHSSLLSTGASPPSSSVSSASSSHPNSVPMPETRTPTQSVLNSRSPITASSPSNTHPHPLPMIPSYSSNFSVAPESTSPSSHGASIPSLPYLQNTSVFHPPGPLHPSQLAFPHHLPTQPPPPPHTPLPFLFHSKKQAAQSHMSYPPETQNHSSSFVPAPVPQEPSENLSDPAIVTTASNSSYPSSRLPPSNQFYLNQVPGSSFPEQTHLNHDSTSAMNVVSLPPYSSFPSSSSLPPLPSLPQQTQPHIPSSPVEANGEHLSARPANPSVASVYANYMGDQQEDRKSSLSQTYMPMSEEGQPLQLTHHVPPTHSPMLAAASDHKASIPSSFVGGHHFQSPKSPNLRQPHLEVPEPSMREPFLEPIDKEVKPSEELLNSIQYQIGETHRGSMYLPMLNVPNAAAPQQSLPPPNTFYQEGMTSPSQHAQYAMPMQNYSSVQYQPALPSNDAINPQTHFASSQQLNMPEENSAQYAIPNAYMGRFPQTSHHPSANLLDASASLNPVQNPLIMLHHANQDYIAMGRPEHSIPEQSHVVPAYSDVDSRFV